MADWTTDAVKLMQYSKTTWDDRGVTCVDIDRPRSIQTPRPSTTDAGSTELPLITTGEASSWCIHENCTTGTLFWSCLAASIHHPSSYIPTQAVIYWQKPTVWSGRHNPYSNLGDRPTDHFGGYFTGELGLAGFSLDSQSQPSWASSQDMPKVFIPTWYFGQKSALIWWVHTHRLPGARMLHLFTAA